jgi:hypothetical protein
MKEIFIVNQVKLGKRNDEFPRHAFSTIEEADRFCVNFIYTNSTMEDRQNDKININDFYAYIEYSMFTNFYGQLTLRIRKTVLD